MRCLAAALLLFLAAPLLATEPKAIRRDVHYAEMKHARQTLDIYAPREGSNHPIMIYIHGGGWKYRDKAEVEHKPRAFVDRGMVFVSVNYRMRDDNVTIKQMAQDVARAIHWMHDHARDYRGDPDTFFVMGHSAGAQLAALVCTDDRYLKEEKLSFKIVKGCVPVDGDTYDAVAQIASVEKKRAVYYLDKFGDERSQKEASPITYVAKGKNIPPFLILHVANHPETRGQSEKMVKALREAGIAADTYPAEGKDHDGLNDDLGTPGDKPTQALFEFLGKLRKQ